MTKLRIVSGNAVRPTGVIGYDFFANITLVVDRLGGKMVKQCNEISGAFNTL